MNPRQPTSLLPAPTRGSALRLNVVGKLLMLPP
jgi:hypothetical protein